MTAGERIQALLEKQKKLKQEIETERGKVAKQRRKLDTRSKIVAGGGLKKLVDEGDFGAVALLRRVAADVDDAQVRAMLEGWVSGE